ncbi:AAA family ATPase [Mycoplasma sp. Mirounga ES2805-ORL]|uniref:AAA family ATPase n=1 Tax=Mycoplasma sp. Mirounga ES2805-ORL TaxID=754514 RepID=UPI00197B1F25|nr:AAA family ATPase [Mycoplasma sp. Mirounga ES2805-ORL]QSF13909.1 AAA family ATPase [Mycoplasma sp. Mirounga ES2805-ORL]
MKLIKVEAHGFKSFAEPISLKFDGGVVGIVGPNGSGKSNINDAIKWVLGERSAKELRGNNMDDVIFAGSKTAQPLNKAIVTLTFDNKDGLSSIPHETVVISRVLERGTGNNVYYLNGEVCRQKDILSIAMESGIGKSSLAIISQGTVSDIAEATAEERKAIFEEAAGVSKYKFRKKEALSKLSKTQEGLDQIRLLIAEIERKLNPLRKQAEKAKVYIAKSEELKSVEVGLLVDNIQHFGGKYEELSLELEGVAETKSDLEKRSEEAEAKINQNQSFKATAEAELKTLSIELESVRERLNKLGLSLARENERERMIAEGQLKVDKDETIKAYKKLLISHGNRINYLKKEIQNIENKIKDNQNNIQTYDDEINLITVKFNKKKNDLFKVETHLNILNSQKENNTFLFKGTKNILENKSYFGRSLKGTVADLIKVPNEYLTAIEAILANASQHLVVDTSETAVKGVNFLKENNGGRATFIPLSVIQPKSIRDDHLLAIQGHPGFIGIACDLINIDPSFDVLSKFLLGNIIIADDVQNANKISGILDRRYMVVSLDGDTIRAGGVIMGGTKASSQSMLNFDEKIKQLQDLIPGLEADIHANETKLNEIQNYRHSAIELDAQLKNQKTNLVVDERQEQALFDEYNIKLKSISNQQIELEDKGISAQSQQADLQVLESRKVALEAEFRAKSERVDSIGYTINSTQKMKNDYDTTLRNLLVSFAKKIAEKEKSKLLLDQSRERLAAQYKMTFESAAENFKLEMNRDKAEEIVRFLREEIDKLGSVNLEALETLVEEEKRYNNYVDGEKELSEAKETIENAIADMDKIITTRLANIIHDVNDEFNNVFNTMFGGGHAKLYFTDPKNILDSGVEIEAQPPGKNIKNLKLFSGGEKSLIAISLLFGILKARPLPLCILDEVEAALDEANVVRYAEYLQKLKPKTQFLVITHRHGTMSRVDSLFGATMQNRGMTTFFTIELAEAKKLVEDEQKEPQDKKSEM